MNYSIPKRIKIYSLTVQRSRSTILCRNVALMCTKSSSVNINHNLYNFKIIITMFTVICLGWHFPTCGKHLHDRTILLRADVQADKTSLAPLLSVCIKPGSERPLISVLVVSILILSTVFYLILELFLQYGASVFHFCKLRNIDISNDNGSFTFYVDVFFPLSPPRLLPDLTVSISNTEGVV